MPERRNERKAADETAPVVIVSSTGTETPGVVPVRCDHPRLNYGPSGVHHWRTACPDCFIEFDITKWATAPGDPYLPPLPPEVKSNG